MAELRHQAKISDLYDRLIDRLGLALDMAKTAVRLRDEHPLELELRGLSHAEFQLIEAYLDRSEIRQAVLKQAVVKEETLGVKKGSSSASREPSEPSFRAPRPAANVIWLKDQRRAKVSAKLSRYSSSKHFKR
ncbi:MULTISPECIES: hypothetical protein [unclassified Pseudomonas]|uniref:hypothetical protein n=1 Tax=unclassified Pseudomonas TaxID=196821 RepID=UPI000D3B93D6|nr:MULTISPECIES: hypothetical protein [unclassified Pseudomonas]RAU42401.1 hypothetical protein DBP26_021420 [Pseudomonas sp. RIT 409]RAU50668.1 hypothetical protein DBY65_021805 [Pseudomonas sp. RIT 412]